MSTGVRPTPMGQRFVEGAQDIMEQLNELEHQFKPNQSVSSMELDVASMSYQFMQGMLKELYEYLSPPPGLLIVVRRPG